MSLRSSLRAALALLALAVSASSAAAGPWVLSPNDFHASLGGSFFSAGSAYNADGDRVALGGLAERRAIDASVEFSVRRWLGMRLAIPVVSATSRDNSSGTAFTNTGLGDLRMGLRVPIVSGATALALNLDWQAPSGYNRVLAPLVADDAGKGAGAGLQKLEASLQLGLPLGQRGFLQLGGGYRHEGLVFGSRKTDGGPGDPELDWADHMTADAALGVWFTERLLVAGVYRAEIAGATGRQVAGPGNTLVDDEVTTQLAGSRITYRVDDRLDVFAGSWHSPGGTNVLHLDQFHAGIAWKSTRLNRLQGFLGNAKRP